MFHPFRECIEFHFGCGERDAFLRLGDPCDGRSTEHKDKASDQSMSLNVTSPVGINVANWYMKTVVLLTSSGVVHDHIVLSSL